MKHYFVRVEINKNEKIYSFGTVLTNDNLDDFINQTENLSYKVKEIVPICEELYVYIKKMQTDYARSEKEVNLIKV